MTDDLYEDDEVDEYWPDPIECVCGDFDYWCETCGYHDHECPVAAADDEIEEEA